MSDNNNKESCDKPGKIVVVYHQILNFHMKRNTWKRIDILSLELSKFSIIYM